MELEQLTPRVYQLPFSQENDRPALGYIRGDRFSLMVDAGNSSEHVRDYQKAVENAGFPQPGFYGADPFPLGSLFRAVCPVDPVHCLCADETVSGDGLPAALDTGCPGGKRPERHRAAAVRATYPGCISPNRNRSGWCCPR